MLLMLPSVTQPPDPRRRCLHNLDAELLIPKLIGSRLSRREAGWWRQLVSGVGTHPSLGRIGVQSGSIWSGDLNPTIGTAGETEPSVNQTVVVGAEKNQLVESGSMTDLVGHRVVGVAPADWSVTSGKHAPPISLHQGGTLVGGGIAASVGDTQDSAGSVQAEQHQQVVNIGITERLIGGKPAETDTPVGDAASPGQVSHGRHRLAHEVGRIPREVNIGSCLMMR